MQHSRVERLLAWLGRYHRLNIVWDRKPEFFAGHIWITITSVIARRIVI
jgi:hypothetical protein